MVRHSASNQMGDGTEIACVVAPGVGPGVADAPRWVPPRLGDGGRGSAVAIAPGERRLAGDAGEAIARDWLRAAGWEILDQNVNFRCGELDIVARERQQIVFVEVRSRWTARGGTGAHSVGRAKQQRLTRAANLYLQRQGWTRVSARFDAISVDLRSGRVVDHFRGAFDAYER